MAPLAVVTGRAAPLGVQIDAVVVRVPSHVVPVRKVYALLIGFRNEASSIDVNLAC